MSKKTVLVVLAFFLVSTFAISQASDTPQSASDLLHASVRAMGGEAALRGIHFLQFTAAQERNALEQSEWPEGPYIAESDQVTEWRDFAGQRWRRASKQRFAWQRFSMVSVVAGGACVRLIGSRAVPGNRQDMQEAEEALALSPERILLTALAGSDPHRLPDAALHAAPQNVIAFNWHKVAVKLFLSATTHLPSAVEWTQSYPNDMFWSVWGDVTTRVEYSLWWLAGGGLHYPLQLDITRNGLADRKITITDLKINAQPAESLFQLPAEAKSAFLAHPPASMDDWPLALNKAQEIAAGVIFFPGSWNTTLVKQADGIVVLEAPISSGYSSRVIAEAQRRFPGTPIKALVSTSDSWPHIGGVREYVARGVPVYALDRTLPLLRRLLVAPRKQVPDALARSPRAPQFIAINGKVVIGSGPNRIEIYPIQGQSTERQMMVYFPGHRLLYGSDAFQKLGAQYFYPQTVSEVRDAVARERLAVDRFFMMHMVPTPWKEVLSVHGGPIPPS